MLTIHSKERLNKSVTRIRVNAPLIAAKAQPGQFVILRASGNSERIPLTIADSDTPGGLITLIYQVVGAGTMELDELEAGMALHDLVGPLGVPTHTEGLKRVCVIGGGVGCAIAYPIVKKLHQQFCCVDSIIGTSPNPLIRSTTPGLETNRWGCIVVQEDTGLTSRKGVYAGGDVVTRAATVILAMGAGKSAAQAIHKELGKEG